jgi:hypothetical protein
MPKSAEADISPSQLAETDIQITVLTAATSPKPISIVPEILLTHIIPPDWSLALNELTPVLRMTHQSEDPEKTPDTRATAAE